MKSRSIREAASLRRIRPFLALLTVLLVSSIATDAQVTSVTIHGTVTEPTGAVIPNAQVTAINTETNFSRSVHTDSAGQYAVQFLPIKGENREAQSLRE